MFSVKKGLDMIKAVSSPFKIMASVVYHLAYMFQQR